MLKPAVEAFEILKKPFSPEDIEWRIGRKNKDKTKAEVLAYVTARAVMERFDEAVGAENWSIQYMPIDMGHTSTLDRNGNAKDLKGFRCQISIDVAREVEEGGARAPWTTITREDVSQCTDVEPLKGGASGAMKRAAVQFGVGRYLYNLKSTWVNIDQYGNFKAPKLPDWALPEGYKYTEDPVITGTPGEGITMGPTEDDWNEVPVNNFTEPVIPADGDMTLTFGKHKGKKFSEIGLDYVSWLANNANKEDVKNAAIAWVSSHQGGNQAAADIPW